MGSSKEGNLAKKEITKTNSENSKRVFLSHISVKIGIVLIGVIVALAIGVLIFNLSYSEKIFPKTIIGGVDLGGMDQAQAQTVLDEAIQTKKDQKMTLVLGDKKVEISKDTLQVKYDLKASSTLAWGVGRKGSFIKVFKEQLRSIFGLNNTNNLIFSYENSKMEQVFSDFAGSLASPIKETTIILNNLEPSIQVGQEGDAINEEEALKKVMTFWGQLESSREEILNVGKSTPRVTQDAAQVALDKTKLILASYEIALSANDKKFTLKSDEFAGWLEFVPSKNFWTRSWSLEIKINDGKVSKYIEELAKQIDQEPKNAKFSVDSGKVTAFEISQDGRKLDQTKSEDLLQKAILEITGSVVLPVEVAKATVSSDTIASKDFKELVGEGTTSWRGSAANRVHNLTLGSQKISGSVVMPGEEFSTIKAISPITAEAGFRQELVIKNSNEVVPEVGGGLCQVSTTLFRSVLNAGLKITARDNHSFRVSYYEPPVGMDATIYDPKPDFKFVNNMKTPILIWAVPTDTNLTFQIFGIKDERKVEISDPILFNYVSPGDTVYRETATMETGAMRLVERATRGVTASFTYKVTSASGEVLEDDKYVSKYVPVPETYLVGPGTQIPVPTE